MLNLKENFILLLIIPVVLYLPACTHPQKPTMFVQLEPEQTGIYFNNDITEQESDASRIHEFSYMGGGVGIGDFNNDGWKDLFFAGNQVSSRLYINKKNVRFEDFTKKAGLATRVWATGVSITDINNDGYDDIYVCVYGGKNLLFINQQDLTFTEKASAYGLADESYSTQAVFFDYNQDGKTDLFLANYLLNGSNPNLLHPEDDSGNSPANDKLYRNIGAREESDHPYFIEVSKQAGIKDDGYGLGVSASDFNGDSWPDIYVANDFLANDKLWLNNKDGTFTNVTGRTLRHQSYSSMGVDAADINNDLLPDILTLDMMPETNERKKLQYSFMDYDRYRKERALGYEPAFMRNTLQLNNGVRPVGNRALPFFSDIGRYAGIAETDWSWSILAADFNNDRWKDIFITNGSGRDFLNADFIAYSLSEEAQIKDDAKRRNLLTQKLHALGYVELPNYFYLNNHDYTFTNMQDSSGLAGPSISNGAAYVDIENDGDLDLIVSNINEPASVFINTTIRSPKKDTGKTLAGKHYLQVELQGKETNQDAFGTKVFLYAGDLSQMQEQYPVRGYLSSVDSRLHFGLGSVSRIDSVVVVWPDRKTEVLKNIPSDTLLHIQYEDAQGIYDMQQVTKNTLFRNITKRVNIHYKHEDVPYNDFKAQPLLPQKYSQLGPFITTGDVDRNGLTDFFVGGGFNASGAMFKQLTDGTFHHITFDTTIKYQEDMDCVFFDADGDSDLDLLITYGGTRYNETSVYYKPRLYINDGKGNYALHGNAIPDHVRTIAGAAAVGDYDGDGHPDLFIGGRVSKMYPLPPRSFLLHNNGGTFTDVTAQVCPALQRPGMITSAVWTDIDNDTRPDLVIAGEWMSLRFFKNDTTRLREVTNQTGLTRMKGLWRSLAACDIDKDGDTDFVAGNIGENNKYDVTARKPLKLFTADLDGNGITDPVMFYYIKDHTGTRNLHPAVNRDKLLRQVRSLRRIFPSNKAYSTAAFDDIFGHIDKDDLLELTCNETRSCYIENRGDGTFTKHILPDESQFAPVNAIICSDLNEDGYTDLLVAGNEYQTAVRTGRYDASYGYFLKGTGRDIFEAVEPVKSGFIVDGDVKDMALIQTPENQKLVLVAVNNDSLRVFRVR